MLERVGTGVTEGASVCFIPTHSCMWYCGVLLQVFEQCFLFSHTCTLLVDMILSVVSHYDKRCMRVTVTIVVTFECPNYTPVCKTYSKFQWHCFCSTLDQRRERCG